VQRLVETKPLRGEGRVERLDSGSILFSAARAEHSKIGLYAQLQFIPVSTSNLTWTPQPIRARRQRPNEKSGNPILIRGIRAIRGPSPLFSWFACLFLFVWHWPAKNF
jgi:hypothetical protein